MEDGGPAFPQWIEATDNPNHVRIRCKGGMSLRAHFAEKAMQGMLACQDFVNDLISKKGCESKEEVREEIARFAVLQADALLKELEKEA